MLKIFKYPFEVKNKIIIDMPFNANLLTVQTQSDVPCIWAMVDPENTSEPKKFKVFGTGHQIDEANLNYIGTFQLYQGNFIGHLFEVME